MKKLLFISLLSSTLSSCFTDITNEISYEPTMMIVGYSANSAINTGLLNDTIDYSYVQVLESSDINAVDRITKNYIKNALVIIKNSNDLPNDTLFYVDSLNGYYSDKTIFYGTSYWLEVSINGTIYSSKKNTPLKETFTEVVFTDNNSSVTVDEGNDIWNSLLIFGHDVTSVLNVFRAIEFSGFYDVRYRSFSFVEENFINQPSLTILEIPSEANFFFSQWDESSLPESGDPFSALFGTPAGNLYTEFFYEDGTLANDKIVGIYFVANSFTYNL